MFKSNNILSKDGEAYYLPAFFSEAESKVFFDGLQQEIAWEPDQLRMFGKLITTRRKVAWYGDAGMNYTYSGMVRQPLCWNNILLEIKQRIEEKTKHRFNSCLLNFYHDGNDGMGWHQDNEKELGEQPVIASVSLGATRPFDFRHLLTAEKIRILLEPGSLFLMRGHTQEFWKHSLPKTKKNLHPRINLTFREIIQIKTSKPC